MARDITTAVFGSHYTTTRRLILLIIACLFLSNAALLSQATSATIASSSSSAKAATASKSAAQSTTTTQEASKAPPSVPSSSAPVASEELDSDEFEGAAEFAKEDEPLPTPAAANPIDTAAGAVVANGFLATFSDYFDSFLFTFGMSSYRSPYASKYHSQQQEVIPQTFLQKYGVYVLGGSVLCALAGLYAVFASRQGKGSGRRVRRIKRFGANGEEEGEELTEGEDHLATQPLLVEVMSKKAKSQGSDWVEKNLKTDEDGDEAHEFLGPFPATSPKSAAAADAVSKEAAAEDKKSPAAASAPVTKKGGKKK